TLTLLPSRANSCACSRPTALPPTTSSDSGTAGRSIAVVEVRYPDSASPGMSATAGVAPVATRYCPASTVTAPFPVSTASRGPSVNRAVPGRICHPYSAARSAYLPCRIAATSRSLPATSAVRSTGPATARDAREPARRPRLMPGGSRGQQRLGRYTAGVHAGAADLTGLDHQHRLAQPAGGDRGGEP